MRILRTGFLWGIVAAGAAAQGVEPETYTVQPTEQVRVTFDEIAEYFSAQVGPRAIPSARFNAVAPRGGEFAGAAGMDVQVPPAVNMEAFEAKGDRGIACAGLPNTAITDSFLGGADSNTSIPPDTTGAVGPNHVLTALNTDIVIRDKNGVLAAPIVSLDSFFGLPLPGNNPFDPRVHYDHDADRWVIMATSNPQSVNSNLVYAWSDTDDPTLGWTFVQISADPGNTTWADFPGFGFNERWWVFTANQFTFPGNFSGAKMWVIDKVAALAGGAFATTVFNVGFDNVGGAFGFSLQPAVDYDLAGGSLFIMDHAGFTAGGGSVNLLRLTRLDGTGPAPLWSPVLGGPFNPAALFAVPPNFSFTGPEAGQAGSGATVFTNDARLGSSVKQRNGTIWATHSGGLPAGAPNRVSVFWYEITPNLAAPVVQSGVIDGAPTTHRFFPSIAVNCAEDVLLGYSYADLGNFFSSASVGRIGANPPGFMTGQSIYKAGEDVYEKFFSTSGGIPNRRWGDYSEACVDPTDDVSLWTIQEYAETDVGPNQTDDRWGTQWGAVKAPAPACCVGNATKDPGGSVDFGDITAILSNFGNDYGAGNTGQGDANCDSVVNFGDVTDTLSNWLNVCP